MKQALALFPAAGSHNGGLAAVALAMRLVAHLTDRGRPASADRRNADSAARAESQRASDGIRE